MIKFRELSDVVEQDLAYYIHEAVKLNVDGVKVVPKKIDTSVPEDLGLALLMRTLRQSLFRKSSARL